jgi:hypothetical protein
MEVVRNSSQVNVDSGGESRLPPPAPVPGEKSAAEREALDRILASGIFTRSPNLENILVYLCNQYFEGNSHLVKEYSVATEACHRGTDFDPKRDSIVRVEMHRLRRRLQEYYESRGEAEPVRITIPAKSYTPEFEVLGTPIAAPSPPVREVPAEAEPAPPSPPASHSPFLRWGIPIVLVILLAAATPLLWRESPQTNPSPPPSVPESATSRQPAQIAAAEDLRILAGRPKGRYPDRYGFDWQGDEHYDGGSSVSVDNEVRSRGWDSNIFSGKREGDFQYHIPLQPGVYELLVLFAETSYGERNAFGGAESQRTFHILANGKELISNYDVAADAGDLNTATARLFHNLRPGDDGKLHLHFQASLTGKAFVNAIILRPGVENSIRPIRIVCRPHPYRDRNNNLWQPDHYYRGGVQITRPTGADGSSDPDLVKGERYGKFSYTIPVPPGKYQARLFFREYWFSPDAPGKGGPGSRVFDLFCNFKPLLSTYDLIRQSPRSRYIVHTFRGLTPNTDSKLVFDFVPKVNYALLNAIEVADDAAALPPL